MDKAMLIIEQLRSFSTEELQGEVERRESVAARAGKPFKVRITEPGDRNAWYSSRVGEEIEVRDPERCAGYYEVVEGQAGMRPGWSYSIPAANCEVV